MREGCRGGVRTGLNAWLKMYDITLHHCLPKLQGCGLCLTDRHDGYLFLNTLPEAPFHSKLDLEVIYVFILPYTGFLLLLLHYLNVYQDGKCHKMCQGEEISLLSHL